MNSITPAAPGTEAAQAWVLAFAEGWLAPASADAFADHFQPWFDPQIRLIQPQLPTLVGQQAFRERLAIGADCAYIELTLRGTLGGRPIAWRVCDRATLREGLVVERESYFDPTPLLRAILTRPRAWPELARARRRSGRPRTLALETRPTERAPIRPSNTRAIAERMGQDRQGRCRKPRPAAGRGLSATGPESGVTSASQDQEPDSCDLGAQPGTRRRGVGLVRHRRTLLAVDAAAAGRRTLQRARSAAPA